MVAILLTSGLFAFFQFTWSGSMVQIVLFSFVAVLIPLGPISTVIVLGLVYVGLVTWAVFLVRRVIRDATPVHAILASVETFIGLDRIEYGRIDGGYWVRSYHVPMGPADVYNSKDKAWTFDE